MQSEATWLWATLGMPDGYRFYLRMLNKQGNSVGGNTYGVPVAEVYAAEIVRELAPEDPDIIRIKNKTKEKSAERITALQGWLKKKIAELEKRKGR